MTRSAPDSRPRPVQAGAWLIVAAVIWAWGCASPPGAKLETVSPPRAAGPVAPLSPDADACARRMHDLCGALLIYHLRHGRLPDTLAALPPPPGTAPADHAAALHLTCPESGQPYVYLPQGMHLPERQQWIIVHDPLPSHPGYRWAIRLDAASSARGRAESGALVLKVVAVPESAFLLRRQP